MLQSPLPRRPCWEVFAMGKREITRRQLLGLAAAPLVALAGAREGKASLERRPNVLLILSDDQPYYTLQYMPKTLSWLSPGMEFVRAYVTSPVCSPSRASIHTGLYAHNHRTFINEGAAVVFNREGNGRRSIGHLLSEVGYECGFFGKWMNGYDDIPA